MSTEHFPVEKSDEEWRRILTPEQYAVLRGHEAVATRLQVLAKFLDRRRDAVLAGHGLQWWEFKTLHMLRRGGPPYRATPGELATQLWNRHQAALGDPALTRLAHHALEILVFQTPLSVGQ